MIDFVCPNCGNEIHAQDSAAGKRGKCKSCDQVITVPASSVQSDFEVLEETGPIRSTAPPADFSKSKPVLSGPSLIGLGCAVIIFVPIVLCGFLGMVTPKGNLVQRDRESKAIAAWTAAQHFVTGKLKSPNTADYGGISNYQDPTKCVTDLGDGTFRVRGWVDSQNSFGAIVHNKFSLTVKDEGSTWALVGKVEFE